MKNVNNGQESPDYLRTSTAAALTLEFKNGRFYRNAKLYCINLLLVYNQKCAASCAYCGLSGRREEEFKEKSFIRVDWPAYRLEEIIEKMGRFPERVKRICISMITRKSAPQDTTEVIRRIRKKLVKRKEQ